MKNISEQCWTSTWPTHMWREGKRHPARPPTALSEGHFFNTSRSFDPVKLGNKGVDGGLHYTGNASEVQPERFNLILFSYQWKNITSYKRLILFILFLKAWWMTPIKCRKKKKKKIQPKHINANQIVTLLTCLFHVFTHIMLKSIGIRMDLALIFLQNKWSRIKEEVEVSNSCTLEHGSLC